MVPTRDRPEITDEMIARAATALSDYEDQDFECMNYARLVLSAAFDESRPVLSYYREYVVSQFGNALRDA